MKLLDLFCGAGGAAKGYHDAGFTVVGVDIEPQPRYPYEFHHADAMTFPLDGFDAIHASPPCQHYSYASNCRPGLAAKYPDLVGPVRERLQATGLPYVIENVPGAPLHDPVELCGCHFGLTVMFGGAKFGLYRPRLFESNFPIPQPGPHRHEHRAFSVFGHGRPGNRPDMKGPGYAAAARAVMGCEWMRRDELDESIPPAFAEYAGLHLMSEVTR